MNQTTYPTLFPVSVLLSIFGTLSLIFCVLLVIFIMSIARKQPSIVAGFFAIGCLGGIFYLVSQINVRQLDINMVILLFVIWISLCVASSVTTALFQNNTASYYMNSTISDNPETNTNTSKTVNIKKYAKIVSGALTAILGAAYVTILLVMIAFH